MIDYIHQHKRLSSRRTLKQLERDNQIALINTFHPIFVSFSKDLSQNFNERLKSFENKRLTNKVRMLEEIESNNSKKCSFSPNILITQRKKSFSKSPSSKILPAYERLISAMKL